MPPGFSGVEDGPEPISRRGCSSQHILGERDAERILQTVVELHHGQAVKTELPGQVAVQSHRPRDAPVEFRDDGDNLAQYEVGITGGFRGHG
jgi:hypothetical protein